MIKARLRNARSWLILVLTYYVLKAGLISYPTFHTRNDSTKVVEIIQSVLAFATMVAVA